jgi:hypothetical protein
MFDEFKRVVQSWSPFAAAAAATSALFRQQRSPVFVRINVPMQRVVDVNCKQSLYISVSLQHYTCTPTTHTALLRAHKWRTKMCATKVWWVL